MTLRFLFSFSFVLLFVLPSGGYPLSGRGFDGRDDPLVPAGSVGEELTLGEKPKDGRKEAKGPVVGSEEGLCSKTCVCMMRELAKGEAAFSDHGLEKVSKLERYCSVHCCDAQEFLDPSAPKPCEKFIEAIGVPRDYSISRRVCMEKGPGNMKEFNHEFLEDSGL